MKVLRRQREPVVDVGGSGGWGICEPAVNGMVAVPRDDLMTP
jgi:hypothetical protein